MKCKKAQTGECRAEDKQGCEIYMIFWKEGVEEGKQKAAINDSRDLLTKGIDKALKNQKRGRRVGRR